jgi:hypothetical protein
MWTSQIRAEAVRLRKEGKMYKEICEALDVMIPKGTMSFWCKGIAPPEVIKETYWKKNLLRLAEARKIALEVNKRQREKFFSDLRKANAPLVQMIGDVRVAKIALAMLYLGEGAKTRASIKFGNSNPDIIELFMSLVRKCYKLDETKFRAMQGRSRYSEAGRILVRHNRYRVGSLLSYEN